MRSSPFTPGSSPLDPSPSSLVTLRAGFPSIFGCGLLATGPRLMTGRAIG